MKPFSQRYLDREERIFNYRLSRGRRVVENAFGILANRFRCLLGTLETAPDACIDIVKACICMHNIMRIRYPGMQKPDITAAEKYDLEHPNAWKDAAMREEVRQAGRGPRQTAEGKMKRVYLKNYVVSPAGSVPWQDEAIDK